MSWRKYGLLAMTGVVVLAIFSIPLSATFALIFGAVAGWLGGGSVAEKVVKNSQVPVLVVPG